MNRLHEITEIIRSGLIPKECYLHSNGFAKLTFIHKEKLFRVHVWNSIVFPYDNKARTPHNHPWSFYSKILKGSLTCDLYLEGDGCEFFKYHCVAHPVHGVGHRIDKKGRADLFLKASFTLTRGSRYFHEADVVHDIYPASRRLCATLFETSNRGQTSTLYSKTELPKMTINRHMDSSEIEAILQSILK